MKIPFLQNHPFAVEAFFTSSVVLTFALPKDELQAMLPPCLKVDDHNSMWGFVAVAMVQTKDLRPKSFPKLFGNDFFLIGYRIFVRYTNKAGKNLRGLYILKSETDSKQMEILGSLFTNYNYETIDIKRTDKNGIYQVKCFETGLNIKINTNDQEPELPSTSPFDNWKEARKFAGPLPFTFSYNSERKEIVIVQGVRENWTPRPVSVIECNIPFLAAPVFQKLKLANAFIIENIPYHWKKGKVEKWPR